jgi:regulator of cell morphogenesis and NO signaling
MYIQLTFRREFLDSWNREESLMNAELLQQTVGGLVAERPSRARLFEHWGIDYCCGGKQRLEAACVDKPGALDAILRDLQAEGTEERGDRRDWTTARLSELIADILTTHHAYLREALPRLSFLTQKVRNAHAQRHPELVELADIFAGFRAEMESHTQAEEKVFFPRIDRLERAETLPASPAAAIGSSIRVLEKEHAAAGAALETMRRLTNGFTLPEDGCATYRAMLDGLAELESDTHRHVHKENSILFPRAEAREAELAAARPAQKRGN